MIDPIQEEKDAARKEEFRKRRAERDRSDLKKVLEMPEGRRFLWKLMSGSRVFSSIFTNNALEMSFREGRRTIGLEILQQITNASPDALTRMQKERESDGLMDGPKETPKEQR